MNGWRLPYPHEILGVLMAFAAAAIAAHLFPDGSVWTRICAVVALMSGSGGVISAAMHLPPHVKDVLAAHDEDVKTALASSPNPPTPVAAKETP